MAGRPEKYTNELAAKILEQIATSSNSLKIICEANNLSVSTVQKWLREDKEFSINYARAKQEQADFIAEEIFLIADTPLMGKKIKTKVELIKDDEGNIVPFESEQEITEGDNIERSKIMIDARKWHAAHLNPKKYGNQNKPNDNDTPPISFEDFINKIDEV